jgi:hypothetical protein
MIYVISSENLTLTLNTQSMHATIVGMVFTHPISHTTNHSPYRNKTQTQTHEIYLETNPQKIETRTQPL